MTDVSSKTAADRLTIISVSYNSAQVMARTLPSLPAGVAHVIVDNAGRDHAALAALAEARGARLVTLEGNEGFGRACNRGAALAETEFLLFLNPDAALEPGALDALVAAADAHPEAVAFNPRIADDRGRPDFKRGSWLIDKSDWLARGWPDEAREMPVLSGAALFVRRADFEAVGGFDPQIFMYHEDDDLAIRLREDRGALRFVPDAHVMHLGGHGSARSPKVARIKAYAMGRSRVYSAQKHHRPLPRLRSLATASLQLLSPLVLLSRRKRAKQGAFLRGVVSALGDGGAYVPGARSSQPQERRAKRAHGPKLPWWKVRRELARLWRQIAHIPPNLFAYLVDRPWYDLVTARQIRVTKGQMKPADRVAIYLIFPRNGLLPSHDVALDYLNARGIAPLVVSNLPLSDADRAHLESRAWKVLERPNFGYDFGGYRDAILHLRGDLPRLDRLFILNDSSWFPFGGGDWIAQADALGVDFAGAASNYGITRLAQSEFRDVSWTYTPRHRNFHYCSFALSIGPTILRDPKFLKFWKKYRLTNHKNRTVRRGEIGLSQWVLRNGFTHAETCQVFDLDKELAALPDERLGEIAERLIIPEDKLLSRTRDKVLASDPATPEGRHDRIALILTTVARQGVSYSLAEYTTRERNFPFLKKSPLWLDRVSSDISLELIAERGGAQADAMLAEARQLRPAQFDREVRPGDGPDPNILALARTEPRRLFDEDFFAAYRGGTGVTYGRHEPWLGMAGALAEQIVALYGPGTSLDTGCGYGFLVEALCERGVDAFGFDISHHAMDEAREDMTERLWQHSILDPIPRRAGGKYDIVTCIDVLQHLPPESAARAVANLCAVTDRVVFSATPEGLDEPTHINLLPPEAWLKLFGERGFTPVAGAGPLPLAHGFVVERTARGGLLGLLGGRKN